VAKMNIVSTTILLISLMTFPVSVQSKLSSSYCKLLLPEADSPLTIIQPAISAQDYHFSMPGEEPKVDTLRIPFTFEINGEFWVPDSPADNYAEGAFRQHGAAGRIHAWLNIRQLNERSFYICLEKDDNKPLKGTMRFTSTEQYSDNYFGTGERFTTLDLKHHLLRTGNMDAFGSKGLVTHKCVPFFMGRLGYGIEMDHDVEVYFDFEFSKRGEVVATMEDDHLGFYYYAGPDLCDVLAAYTSRVGRPNMPPRWAYAPIIGRNRYWSQEEVLLDIKKVREHNLPTGGIQIDSPWSTCYNDFIWDRIAYPDLESTLEKIREAGIEVILWITVPLQNKLDHFTPIAKRWIY